MPKVSNNEIINHIRIYKFNYSSIINTTLIGLTESWKCVSNMIKADEKKEENIAVEIGLLNFNTILTLNNCIVLLKSFNQMEKISHRQAIKANLSQIIINITGI